MATAATLDEDRPVEAYLAGVLQLGIASAHFAARGSADLQGFASGHSGRMVPLTLPCPAVLDTRTLVPLAERLLVVTDDHAPGARRARAGLDPSHGEGRRLMGFELAHGWTIQRSSGIGYSLTEFRQWLPRRCGEGKL